MIENREVAAAWLAERKPDETHKQMVSLVQQFGMQVHDNHRLEYPKEGGFRRVHAGTECRGVALTEEQSKRLQGFFAPADDGKIEVWLAELSVITARRADDDFSGALRLKAYTDRLAEYPADIAKAALLSKAWHFFPTWADLRAECERLLKPRQELLSAAENPKPKEGARVIKLPSYEKPPTQAERGPLPFKPDPTPPVANVEHLKEELEILQADEALAKSEHGQAYAQSLIQRIAAMEGPKPVHTTKAAS
jgi:hypothetical protein